MKLKDSTRTFLLIVIPLIVVSIFSFNKILPLNSLPMRQTSIQTKSNFSLDPQINYDSNSPEGVANNFYNWYLNCLNKHFESATGKTSQEDCPYEKSSYIGTQLIENIQSRYGDPILCAQNTPVKITVDRANITGNKSSVVVHTIFESSRDNPLNVELQLIDKKWKIINITCPSR